LLALAARWAWLVQAQQARHVQQQQQLPATPWML